MKSILISIKPEWVAKILNGEKTIEIRKTAPKCDLPIEVYIYCTKQDDLLRLSRVEGDRFIIGRNFDIKDYYRLHSAYNGKGGVVAKFILSEVEEIVLDPFGYYAIKESNQVLIDQECWICKTCITNVGLAKYLKGKAGYAWHISDLVIFDRPRELQEFGLTKAPESWFYCEERYPGATMRKIELPKEVDAKPYKKGKR